MDQARVPLVTLGQGEYRHQIKVCGCGELFSAHTPQRRRCPKCRAIAIAARMTSRRRTEASSSLSRA